jgi:hypothetical protein
MNIDKNLKFNPKDAQDMSNFLEIMKNLKPILDNEREEAEKIESVIKDELAHAGVKITSLSEIIKDEKNWQNYPKALPILIKWFKKVDNAAMKEELARELSVSWANPLALHPLIEEFEKFPDTWIWHNAKWAIGNALDATADDSIFPDLERIVKNKDHGYAREMVVLALAKMKKTENRKKAINILIKLLDDEEVVGHAIISLRKLKALEARSNIEPFLKYPITWIRNEAKKTIILFDKSK